MKKALIFDVDGTLADVRSIRHLLVGFDTNGGVEDEDFNQFHIQSVDMPVVEFMASAARKAAEEGYSVLVVTSRKLKWFANTALYFCNNDIPCEVLFMRDNNDDRPGHEYKREVFTKIQDMGYEIIHAFDDDPSIIKVLEDCGIYSTLIVGYGFDYENV